MNALMPTYQRHPVAFSHGIGAELFDADGRCFLDGLSGIAVTNLGHAHPRLTSAISEQAARLLHCSNLFRIEQQESLGERLTRAAGMERVFFGNSGAEANEAAIKLARLHAHQRGIERPQLVVLEGAFHGRTLATLSASGSRRIQAGFEPLVDGFLRVPRNDLPAVEQVAEHNHDVCAVLLEPVQGESGIHPLDADYLRGIADLCQRKGWLLIFDEVQCGNGRTGSHYYYQQLGIAPDVLTTAKGLGNGVPIGACMARGEAASVFGPGHHGSTYGGNPLACAAATAVLDALESDDLAARAQPLARALIDRFRTELRHHECLREIRSAGLMIGIELDRDCGAIAGLALENGLLLNVTAGSTLRLLPPLVMSDAQAADFGGRLAQIVDRWLESST